MNCWCPDTVCVEEALNTGAGFCCRRKAQDVYAFLIKRPVDKESWPTVFQDRERAENYPHRASDVVEVRLPLTVGGDRNG